VKVVSIILTFIIILACLHLLFEIIHLFYLKNHKNKIIINSNNWYGGIFYYNPDDQRIIVPKRIEWLGWTLNYARPTSLLIIAAILLIIILGILQ